MKVSGLSIFEINKVPYRMTERDIAYSLGGFAPPNARASLYYLNYNFNACLFSNVGHNRFFSNIAF